MWSIKFPGMALSYMARKIFYLWSSIYWHKHWCKWICLPQWQMPIYRIQIDPSAIWNNSLAALGMIFWNSLLSLPFLSFFSFHFFAGWHLIIASQTLLLVGWAARAFQSITRLDKCHFVYTLRLLGRLASCLLPFCLPAGTWFQQQNGGDIYFKKQNMLIYISITIETTSLTDKLIIYKSRAARNNLNYFH